MLRQAPPQGAARPGSERMSTHTYHARPVDAVRASLTRLEEEIDTAPWPSETPIARRKSVRTTDRGSELIQQTVEGQQVA
jgi:hypothetical protein